MKCIRTCIACRKKDDKKNLIRIISENGEAVIDKIQKANTRGIYMCNNKECIEKLLKVKNINKIIKINVSEDDLKKLLVEMEDM